jgi:hypothetical protein
MAKLKNYVCRWPNGDMSLVQGETKMDAIILLDEVGGAAEEYLHEIKLPLVVHFSLEDLFVGDTHPFPIEVFGEELGMELSRVAYPIAHDLEDPTDKQLMKAVQQERTRVQS